MSVSSVVCVQARHLGVALNKSRTHLWLVGMVFVQVAAQRAEVATAVFTG